jgi:hypothetical protein
MRNIEISKKDMKIKAALVFWLKNTEDGFREEESYRELQNLIKERSSKLKRRPTEIKFGPKDLADHYTCYYCRLAHKNVEAGGMWGCPNITCTGPGNSYYRSKLKSFREEGSKHSVDTQEWLEKVREDNKSVTDPDLIEAVKAGIKKMEVSLTSTKFGL